MRFDDMIATVLRQPLDTPAARAIAWRQAIDLLAQRRGEGGADEAYDMLRHLRADVPAQVRADAAHGLAGRSVPPALLRLFAEEAPAVAAPALASARLAPDEWIALLPELGPTARGFVRNRRDLPQAVRTALDSFGASDLVLGAPPAADAASPATAPAAGAPAEPGPVSIGDVMARIEAFRSRAPASGEDALSPPPDRFRFETDAAGTVVWTDASPRGAVIGATIARSEEGDGCDGVDGQAAGAFRSRAPFRDARLTLAGDGALGGAWRISAVPAFDEADGRFAGYRGVARRPRTDEIAEAAPVSAPFGLGFHPDSLRQLVHELRTPINAIVGFAELIERQILGPAALGYRLRASAILKEGQQLLGAIEDLDSAARIGARRWAIDHGAVDGAALLARLHADLAPLALSRGVALAVRTAAVPPIDADAVAVERMMMRLVQSVLGLAAAGEPIEAALAAGPDVATLEVTRPAAIAGRDERALLDPAFAPDGDWPDAPLLGLGFALRLVRSLAVAARGGLTIAPDAFRLHLPTRAGGAEAESGRG